jgi:hypothetical protein
MEAAGARGFRDKDAGLIIDSRGDSPEIRRLCFLYSEVIRIWLGNSWFNRCLFPITFLEQHY